MPTQQHEIITILIAEDHPATLFGIRSILEKAPDFKIVGEAQDGNKIKQLVAELRPQILLLDLIMPNLSPARLERWVRKNYPDTITLVLTAHDRDAYLSDMMEAGVTGYLDKKLQAGQLISAIRRAARGEILFDKEQMERASRWRQEVTSRWENISQREREILHLLTEGMGNKTIATALNISIDTVEKHMKSIYRKLGVTCRSEAILWWVEKGTDFRN
ncbi:MAG: response regulator transcription factor [Chloroflexi bacterium]|nr:response regulator transcription factor [Chloroflexota bacterium]